MKAAAGSASSQRSWQRENGSEVHELHALPGCATEFYFVTGVMTHLERGTLSCRMAVASGNVFEAPPESGQEVAWVLKAQHRKSCEGINPAVGTRCEPAGVG